MAHQPYAGLAVAQPRLGTGLAAGGAGGGLGDGRGGNAAPVDGTGRAGRGGDTGSAGQAAGEAGPSTAHVRREGHARDFFSNSSPRG